MSRKMIKQEYSSEAVQNVSRLNFDVSADDTLYMVVGRQKR
jgi:hypothetical protein